MGRLTPLLAQHTAQPNTRSSAPTPWAHVSASSPSRGCCFAVTLAQLASHPSPALASFADEPGPHVSYLGASALSLSRGVHAPAARPDSLHLAHLACMAGRRSGKNHGIRPRPLKR
jgi:hypothetical protein